MYGEAPMQRTAEGGGADDPEVAEILKWLRMMRQQGGDAGGDMAPPANSFQVPNNVIPIAWGEEKGGGGGGGGGGNFFSKLLGMFGGGGG
jgi:hypothetical protein